MSEDFVESVKQNRLFLVIDTTPQGKILYCIATDEQTRGKVSHNLLEDHTPEGRKQKKDRQKTAKRSLRTAPESLQEV